MLTLLSFEIQTLAKHVLAAVLTQLVTTVRVSVTSRHVRVHDAERKYCAEHAGGLRCYFCTGEHS